MTREQAKELLPIIQAFAEGKIVQYLDRIDGWRDYNDPSFCGNLKYRIKPEPRFPYSKVPFQIIKFLYANAIGISDN